MWDTRCFTSDGGKLCPSVRTHFEVAYQLNRWLPRCGLEPWPIKRKANKLPLCHYRLTILTCCEPGNHLAGFDRALLNPPGCIYTLVYTDSLFWSVRLRQPDRAITNLDRPKSMLGTSKRSWWSSEQTPIGPAVYSADRAASVDSFWMDNVSVWIRMRVQQHYYCMP